MTSIVSFGRLPRAVLTAAGVLAVVLVTGCGATQSRHSADVVDIKEKDFAIQAPRRVEAGNLVLRVANDGPGSHELIVVRVPRAGLPYRSDGLTVDEEALERDEPGVLEPALPGSVRELRVNLSPGRYVLLCNMSGHYLGGMHALVTAA